MAEAPRVQRSRLKVMRKIAARILVKFVFGNCPVLEFITPSSVDRMRTASEGGLYKPLAGVARSAALGGKRALAKRCKRGGACLLADGLFSSDAVRAIPLSRNLRG